MGKKENVSIIVNGFKEGKTDDEMLKELFEAGVEFTSMRTVFNDIVKEKELRLTSKERAVKTTELLEDTTEIADVDAMNKIVTMLTKKLKVADTKAMGSLRTWAKANGIELPKAPRVSKARKVGFGGHYGNIMDFILAQRKANKPYGKEEVVKFCHDNNIPEAYNTLALNVVHFAKTWNGELEAEVEEVKEAA